MDVRMVSLLGLLSTVMAGMLMPGMDEAMGEPPVGPPSDDREPRTRRDGPRQQRSDGPPNRSREEARRRRQMERAARNGGGS